MAGQQLVPAVSATVLTRAIHVAAAGTHNFKEQQRRGGQTSSATGPSGAAAYPARSGHELADHPSARWVPLPARAMKIAPTAVEVLDPDNVSKEGPKARPAAIS